MMGTWQYGGAAYPFSVTDSGSMQRLKEALAVLKSCELEDDEDQAEAYCRMIVAFFDSVFGSNVGLDITGGDEDGCSAAYLSFVEYVRDQLSGLARLRKEAEEEYLRRKEGFPVGGGHD
ncbi:MAG: hypothetical protein E7638_05875 [Ruminococcaceae bacterium]|nr:hypothetical protein [Oscillospiraceae bacterium]